MLLNTIKNIDSSLGDLRLKNAVYYDNNNSLEVFLISDVVFLNVGIDFISYKIKEALPFIDKISVFVSKSICDKRLTFLAIKDYIKNNCIAVEHLIKDDNIKVLSANKRVVFEISANEDICNFFERTSLIDKMSNYLSRTYCNDFNGSLNICNTYQETPYYEVESVNALELEDSTLRYLKVNSVMKFCDDREYDTAIYIADGEEKIGPVYFAGIVVSKEEKLSKNGKPYYVITIDDKTGKVSGKYFTTDKNKLKKLEKLEVGSVIILRGENELFNGRASLMIKGYHFCEFPPNYTPKEKPSKKAPEKYSVVFPVATETTKQDDFFSLNNEIPKEILNGTYTVVDIETTGTEIAYDKITEIGAVKIVNGVIKEYFQTLINPEVTIPKKIIELTGIDDELVKDSPHIDSVYPDFFKFLGDSVFVAHNAEFDFRFLKNAGKDLGYVLKNDVLDTLALSRKVLPNLKHHKLNNVCEYYGIVFRHHRALSDAFATAELLLELVKGKKSLKDI